MPRYFFHVYDGKVSHDMEGTELPDIDAVRAAAIRASGEADATWTPGSGTERNGRWK